MNIQLCTDLLEMELRLQFCKPLIAILCLFPVLAYAIAECDLPVTTARMNSCDSFMCMLGVHAVPFRKYRHLA